MVDVDVEVKEKVEWKRIYIALHTVQVKMR